jgi:hypothetical protein
VRERTERSEDEAFLDVDDPTRGSIFVAGVLSPGRPGDRSVGGKLAFLKPLILSLSLLVDDVPPGDRALRARHG